MKILFRYLKLGFIVFLVLVLPACNKGKQGSQTKEISKEISKKQINPKDIVYKGAFRLPEPSGDSSWEYSGYAMTYYPDGDKDGQIDGYPGSIFAVGHDQQQLVSEISIPKPVISKDKNLDELNTASTLQEFADITGEKYGELEIPRAGLEYLKMDGNEMLYFAWGQHFELANKPQMGMSSINLSEPDVGGLWHLKDYTSYIVNDYLFEIPDVIANVLDGKRLAAGRFRDGQWGGLGPALLAFKPPDANNPPLEKETIKDAAILLLYGEHDPGDVNIRVSEDRKMKTYKEADEWSGGAWLSKGDKSSVIFTGTKATGKSWYGFANGVEYPINGDENVPEVPAYPYDDRGWWSEDIEAQIIFYKTSDLVDVAKGKKKSWQPQPYATLNIDKYLFETGFDYERQKRFLVGACSFDRERGILYLFERRVDEEKSIVHVFKIN